MKFKELWKVIDKDTELTIFDSDGNNRIDIFADNSFIKEFNEMVVVRIFANNLEVNLSEVNDD